MKTRRSKTSSASTHLCCYTWTLNYQSNQIDPRVHLRSRSNPLRSLCDRLVQQDLPHLPLSAWGSEEHRWCRICRVRMYQPPKREAGLD